MKPSGTLLITRRDVVELLTLDDCIAAVEQAFRLHAEGQVVPPGILGIHATGGGFHIKAAMLNLGGSYFAAKINGNFFDNARRFGMPRIQGIIVLSDGRNGRPLALLDSIEITIIRTGAATAVAAKYLAVPDASTMTVCGCGNQGRVSLKAIARVRSIEHVFAFDSNRDAANAFAAELSGELGIEIEPVDDLRHAVGNSAICVTCTPAKRGFLDANWVRPGTFIAAVGADSEEKQELMPALLAANKVVVDNAGQCATIGELHHAISDGLMTKSDVYAEIGEIIAGQKPPRRSAEEIVIFDSTGIALQDVAAASIVYERALRKEAFRSLDFAG